MVSLWRSLRLWFGLVLCGGSGVVTGVLLLLLGITLVMAEEVVVVELQIVREQHH